MQFDKKILLLIGLPGILIFLAVFIYTYLFVYSFRYTGLVLTDIRTLWAVFLNTRAIHDVMPPLFFTVIAFAGLLYGIIWLVRPTEKLYGDARWARESEVRKAGLRGKSGILLGRKAGRYLFSDGDTGILVCMPPGDAKTAGFAIPNMLQYPDSVICTDPKFEIYDATAGFRKEYGQKVFRFSPMERESHCYNPFDDISIMSMDNDIRKIGSILYPPTDGKDKHWADSARSLFAAVARFLIDNKGRTCFGDIYKTVTTTPDLQVLLTDYLKDKNLTIDGSVKGVFNTHVGRSKDEASGVMSSMVEGLQLFNNEYVDAATAKSDFSFRDFKRTPHTLYICYRNSQKRDLAPLISALVQMAIDICADQLPKEDEPLQLLLLLDEFASLRNIQFIKEGIAMYRGYRVRAIPIVQSLSQLDSILGKHGREELLQACNHQIYSSQNDLLTCDELSKRMMTKTIKKRSRSLSRSGRSKSESEVGRPLMLPQDFMKLDFKKLVLYVKGMNPIKAEKVFYYKDRAFKKRVLPAPVVPKLSRFTFTPVKLDNKTTKTQVKYKAQKHKDSSAMPPELSDDELNQLIESVEL